MQLRNVSPLGHLDVPLLNRPDIEPGEVFDVTAEQAARLLVSDVNFEPVDDEAKAVRAQVIADELAAGPLPFAGQATPQELVTGLAAVSAAGFAGTDGLQVLQTAAAQTPLPAVNDGITGGPSEGTAQ